MSPGAFVQRALILFWPSAALLIGALCAWNVWAGDDLQQQLTAEYVNKILTLRKPYSGDRLQFGAGGELQGEAKLGPWTVDGQVEAKSVTLADRSLKIEGRRVRLFFDPFRRRFRDIGSVRQGDRAAGLFKTFADRERWQQLAEQPVEIDVELASESPDATEISLATEAIFLSPTEAPADSSFWQSYFADKNSAGEADAEFPEDLYRNHEDGVSPPTPLVTPNPEYSDAAREAGFRGRVGLSLVVDKDGSPRNIQVVDPAGLGLDEASVNAVRQWKFRPGEKEARPVNVQLQVEMGFRLY